MRWSQNLCLLIIIFLIAISCENSNEYTKTDKNQEDSQNQEIKPQGLKEWTFLLYDDADFSNAYDPISDFASKVSSNTSINYLVLRDRRSFEAEYFYIDEDHNLEKLKSIGEANMGSVRTVDNFIKFAYEYFPAKRYITAFYDHGGGWKGACWDETNMNDNLTCAEMDEAFTLNGGMDLLLFTAPCLMGAVESAYQVRNSCDFYIGSENISGFIYWNEIWQDFDHLMRTNPLIETKKLSKEIIKLHSNKKETSEYGSNLTMSAIDLSKMDSLVIKLEQIFNYYNKNINDFKVFPLSDIKKFYSNHCDLKELLSYFLKYENNDSIKGLISNSISHFYDCIIAECHGDSIDPVNGLSIYFPGSYFSSEIYYSDYGIDLDFKDNCSWDELILKALKNNFSEMSISQDKEVLKRNTYYPDIIN